MRVAITIGASLPESARSIAITFSKKGRPTTQEEVDKWIDEAASRGVSKITSLSDIYPQWLRLCSITATDGLNQQHFLWNPSTGGPKYDMEDAEVSKMLVEGTALSGIAMCWALGYPNEAQNSFQDPDGIRPFESEMRQIGISSLEPEIRDLVSGPAIYASWLHMAETLVSRYSEAEGLPIYDTLA